MVAQAIVQPAAALRPARLIGFIAFLSGCGYIGPVLLPLARHSPARSRTSTPSNTGIKSWSSSPSPTSLPKATPSATCDLSKCASAPASIRFLPTNGPNRRSPIRSRRPRPARSPKKSPSPIGSIKKSSSRSAPSVPKGKPAQWATVEKPGHSPAPPAARSAQSRQCRTRRRG